MFLRPLCEFKSRLPPMPKGIDQRLRNSLSTAVYTCQKCGTTYRGRKKCPWCGAKLESVEKQDKHITFKVAKKLHEKCFFEKTGPYDPTLKPAFKDTHPPVVPLAAPKPKGRGNGSTS